MRNFINELNEKQYEAVSSTAQFLRIVAGAGSGKTRVLTYRIAYLLEERGVNPWNILAITFTNKVAKEMKERASKLVEHSLNDLQIRTFHSFCAYFLRHEVTNTLGFPSNFIIYDEVDTQEKIKQAALNCGVPKKDKLISEASNYISAMKSEGKYPNDIKVGEFKVNNEKKCLEIYATYESLKFDDMAFDFDDLILKTIQILKEYPEVRRKWSNYYKHILIDEFQDTNDLQYDLIKLLMTPATSLYVVGDPDQTIYTWRGANQNIILDLDKTFPSLKTIILDKNYRSTKTILEHSNVLISNNKLRVKKDLVTDNENGDYVKIFCGFTRNDEADWVAKKIIDLKSTEKDFSFNDVAVLYRSAYLSSVLENKFAMSRIPYIIYGGLRFYQRKEVKIALSYFRLVVNLKEDFSFYKIVNEPKRKIGEQSVLRLQYEAKQAKLSAYEYVKNIENYETELKSSVVTALIALIKILENAHLRFIKKEEAIVAILEDLLNDVHFEEYLIDLENGEERVQNVRALLDQLTSFFKENPSSTLEEFLENISLASAQDEVKEGQKVRMMTIHTAKGLEFKYVFVIGLTEGVFPSQRTIFESPKTGLEEERRLCYVAFTRAMKKLFLSCNRDFSYVVQGNMVPSRFFKEANLDFRRRQGNDSDPFEQFRTILDQGPQKSIFVSLPPKEQPKNVGTKRNKGEYLKHNKFGIGHIVDIVGDILVIDFNEHGIKKIISYYTGLEKVEPKEVEL